MSLKVWVAAARLRTLPLAFSCILLGSAIAMSEGHFSGSILIWSLITTLLYQVLSNYANDYGDGVKGTDENRQGEKRAVASGEITATGMRNAVWIFSVAAWASGAWLSYIGTVHAPNVVFYAFLFLNTGAVISAIRYTVGGSAYGYKGLGDIYVLLFFGWIGVMGSYYLHTNVLNLAVMLPATAVGFLAVGVLNLNNMRDLETDIEHGKHTVPVRMGRENAKVYHSILLLGAPVLMAAFVCIHPINSLYNWTFVLVVPVILLQWRKAMKAQTPDQFDPLLKPLAMSTLLFVLISGIGFNLYNWLA